ncbi:2-methylcitrate dehydratase domain protein [Burkholderia mallei]|nr:2-methylcitrate dehydratase domain protein [Burkholderia mallei]
MVPAARADRGRVHQPACDLVGERDRQDQLAAARMLRLGHRDARGDVVARMADFAARVCVVEIEVAQRGARGERREIGARSLGRSDDRRRSAAAAGAARRVARDAHGRLVERGERATERVDQMRFDDVDRRRVEILVAQPRRVFGELARERGRGGLRCVRLCARAARRERRGERQARRDGGGEEMASIHGDEAPVTKGSGRAAQNNLRTPTATPALPARAPASE